VNREFQFEEGEVEEDKEKEGKLIVLFYIGHN
jgi:hypothetical protein